MLDLYVSWASWQRSDAPRCPEMFCHLDNGQKHPTTTITITTSINIWYIYLHINI